MNKKVIVISSLLIIAAILAGGVGFWTYNTSFVYTNDAVIEPDFVPVEASTSGKIKNIFVKPDQNVIRGQVIAEIEVVENVVITQPADGVKAVSVQKEKLNDAEENYKHFAMMYKDGVIPQEEYDHSLNQLTKAQEDYEKAVEASSSVSNSAKTIVKTNISTSKVYAPKDGVVSLSYLNKGETAMKDKPVVLLDSNRPKVTAYFNPKFAGDLKVGKEVNIRIKQYPSKKFTGVIDFVGTEPEMDAKNKSLVIPVQITFKDELNGYSLEKGQPVQVRFKK